ncbi:MAG: DUF2892 domain-containing protein [Alphaproteobacteria bacterium]
MLKTSKAPTSTSCSILGRCIVSPNRLHSGASGWNSRRQVSPAPAPTQGLGRHCVVGPRRLRAFCWWGAMWLVPIATALIGWRPAYPLLGINTCARNS